MIKQHFSFEWNGRYFGCSFRKAKYCGIYFGRITDYGYDRKNYLNPNNWVEHTNIYLEGKSIDMAIALRNRCKKLESQPYEAERREGEKK